MQDLPLPRRQPGRTVAIGPPTTEHFGCHVGADEDPALHHGFQRLQQFRLRLLPGGERGQAAAESVEPRFDFRPAVQPPLRQFPPRQQIFALRAEFGPFAEPRFERQIGQRQHDHRQRQPEQVQFARGDFHGSSSPPVPGSVRVAPNCDRVPTGVLRVLMPSDFTSGNNAACSRAWMNA